MPLSSLSSLQLDAFLAVANLGHFTRAAKELGVSQSALSQRIKNLEDDLETLLFVRGARGVTLTPAGAKLHRFARARQNLEGELRAELSGAERPMAVRVAGFSSVVRSVVMPALGAVTRAQPHVAVTCYTREVRELMPMLVSGEVDYAIVDRVATNPHVEHRVLGEEENVLVESTRKNARRDVVLDHDEDDATTAAYFAAHRRALELRREYLDDIYTLLDGVEEGLGLAVVPAHLCRGRRGIRRVAGYRVVKSFVVAHFPATSHPTALHALLLDAMTSAGKQALARASAR